MDRNKTRKTRNAPVWEIGRKRQREGKFSTAWRRASPWPSGSWAPSSRSSAPQSGRRGWSCRKKINPFPNVNIVPTLTEVHIQKLTFRAQPRRRGLLHMPCWPSSCAWPTSTSYTRPVGDGESEESQIQG